MAHKMLIDAAHPEETRVVTVRGPRIEEFDFEAANRRQLRGNIYLAKVTRVEPSLQAAFIEYGGNRHGFLAFGEIHPDYYQIPVADRQALLEDEARDDWESEEREEERARPPRRRGRGRGERAARVADPDATVSGPTEADGAGAEHSGTEGSEVEDSGAEDSGAEDSRTDAARADGSGEDHAETEALPLVAGPLADLPDPALDALHPEEAPAAGADADEHEDADHGPALGAAADEAHPSEAGADERDDQDHEEDDHEEHEEPVIEQVGGRGDALAEIPDRPRRSRRQYKIQEVIKRRQVLLVQVVKEERGTKGAALTTYLSLAGRYAVLMPNTGKGGGISRKITSAADRKRLKEIVSDLDVPEGMGVILRTAGAARTRPEIKRDFEYLLRLWESVRELTLGSSAPALVYEEGSLIKRAIRDLYSKEIEEVMVAGEDAYREAKDFMRMLMPSNAKAVQLYRDPQPLFAKHGVEAQLDAMFSSHVSLKSGGYLVINPTEALVSIDVNSGRSTREHNIEDTALRTNLEAAEEVSRQLRLRDLAGLVVIDFIDMEEKRNNRSVEKRLNDCLKTDRARIQVGRISPFGLMEMSRQRIRTGVLESSSVVCPTCGGSGFVRATASVALHILRTLEEALIKSATHNVVLRTRTEVALYVLNQKRAHLRELEERFGVVITIAADESLAASVVCALDRTEPAPPRIETRAPVTSASVALLTEEDEADELVEEEEAEAAPEPEESDDAVGEEAAGRDDGEGGDPRRRRRRRRRRGGRGDGPEGEARADLVAGDATGDDREGGTEAPLAAEGAHLAGDERRGDREGEGGRRRRGRRGGRARVERDGLEAGPADEGRQESRSQQSGRQESGGQRGGRRGRGDGELRSGGRRDDAGPTADAPGASEVEALPEAGREDAPFDLAPPVAAEASTQALAPLPAASLAPVNGAASVEAVPEAEAPAAEPVAVVLTPSDPDRPKRGGWWSRTKAALTGE